MALDVLFTEVINQRLVANNVYAQLRTAGDLTTTDIGQAPAVQQGDVTLPANLVIVETTSVAVADDETGQDTPLWGSGINYVATIEVDLRSPSRMERNGIVDIVTGAAYTGIAGFVGLQVDPTALTANEETGEPLRFEATVNLQVFMRTNPLI